MEQVLSSFFDVDSMSPVTLSILAALVVAALAKVGVITSKNHKAVCITTAIAVGVAYAASIGPDSSLSTDRRVLLLFVQGLFMAILTWGWLYMVVYSRFRRNYSSGSREHKDMHS